jgi:preprotein translocase subunit SecG
MENIILIIHVVIAVLLIGSVLLQRSEGGALGIGAGNDSLMSSRSASDFLTKFTSVMAIFFIITSISLTIIHKKDKPSGSIIDKIEKLEKKNTSPQIPTTK